MQVSVRSYTTFDDEQIHFAVIQDGARLNLGPFINFKFKCMSITIKYENSYGEEITQQQALQSTYLYQRISYENQEMRKRELLSNEGTIENITFYLRNEENLSDFVNINAVNNSRTTFHYNRQITNGYTVWDVDDYNSNIQIAKSKIVNNFKGQMIAYQSINMLTDLPKRTHKYFYLEDFGYFSSFQSVEENGKLEFIYGKNGSSPTNIFVIINLLFHIDAPGGGYAINSNRNIFLENLELASVFNWAEHSYYHSAQPLIPNNISF